MDSLRICHAPLFEEEHPRALLHHFSPDGGCDPAHLAYETTAPVAVLFVVIEGMIHTVARHGLHGLGAYQCTHRSTKSRSDLRAPAVSVLERGLCGFVCAQIPRVFRVGPCASCVGPVGVLRMRTCNGTRRERSETSENALAHHHESRARAHEEEKLSESEGARGREGTTLAKRGYKAARAGVYVRAQYMLVAQAESESVSE